MREFGRQRSHRFDVHADAPRAIANGRVDVLGPAIANDRVGALGPAIANDRVGVLGPAIANDRVGTSGPVIAIDRVWTDWEIANSAGGVGCAATDGAGICRATARATGSMSAGP